MGNGIHSSEENQSSTNHHSGVQAQESALINPDGTLRYPNLSQPPSVGDTGTPTVHRFDSLSDIAAAGLTDGTQYALQPSTDGDGNVTYLLTEITGGTGGGTSDPITLDGLEDFTEGSIEPGKTYAVIVDASGEKSFAEITPNPEALSPVVASGHYESVVRDVGGDARVPIPAALADSINPANVASGILTVPVTGLYLVAFNASGRASAWETAVSLTLRKEFVNVFRAYSHVWEQDGTGQKSGYGYGHVLPMYLQAGERLDFIAGGNTHTQIAFSLSLSTLGVESDGLTVESDDDAPSFIENVTGLQLVDADIEVGDTGTDARFVPRNTVLNYQTNLIRFQPYSLIRNGSGYMDQDVVDSIDAGLLGAQAVGSSSANVSYDPDTGVFTSEHDSYKTVAFLAEPFDPTLPLFFEGLVRGAGEFYVGAMFYDANNQLMNRLYNSYIPGTMVQLTAPFAPGDTVMEVTDASGWVDSITLSGGIRQSGIAFIPEAGFVTSRVVSPPDAYAYTRYGYADTRRAGGGTQYTVSGNTITFQTGVTNAALFEDNQPWPVGTWVRAVNTNGTPRYFVVRQDAEDIWARHAGMLPAFDPANSALAYCVPRDALRVALYLLTHYEKRTGTHAVEQQQFKNLILQNREVVV